jgi:hypothetical protein
VLCRILFYNSDRLALVAAFLALMAVAFTVGLFFGGKTWCNYVCPLAVIQATYTGPGGLFDSKAHLQPTAIPQSMCRTPGPDGDRGACVGCNANCPDVDLENSYWKRIDSDSKRFMYNGLFGLIVAFYSYYYVYSGSWDYYFSGAWTHERSQVATLFAPGFYIGGHAIPIPKLLAAPLYFLVCIFLAHAGLIGIERAYSALMQRRGKPLPKTRLRHRMLTVTGFLSFTVFYFFGGRPNILLMPPWGVKAIDLALAIVSITWFIRSLGREADIYRRESLARTLRQQLARLGFRSEDSLEGRPLEQLSADEVYVLAKTLPNFTQAQKREAYRGILVEALQTGQTKSSESLKTLRDVREQLGLSDSDHAAIAAAIGVEDPKLFDMDAARSLESRLRLDNYRKFLLDLVQQGLADGQQPIDYLRTPQAAAAIAPLRSFFAVTDEEHVQAVAEVAHDDVRFVDNARGLLNAYCGLEAQRFSLGQDARPEARLLRHALVKRARAMIREIVNVLRSLDDFDAARPFAGALRALVGRETEAALNEAAADAPPELAAAFADPGAAALPISYTDVVSQSKPADLTLRALAGDGEPLVAALAVSALAADPARARGLVDELWPPAKSTTPFLQALRADAARGRRSECVAAMADLLNIEAFAELDLDRIAYVAERSEFRDYEPGEAICRMGEPSEFMFVLVKGATEVWIARDEARMTIGRGQKGSVFGELGLITRRPRAATVEVTGGPATALLIPRAIVDDLLNQDLRATRGLLGVVSTYLLDTITATARPLAPAAEAG